MQGKMLLAPAVESWLLIQMHSSAPVGFSTSPGDCLFLPVPCEVKYLDAERSGCKYFFFIKIQGKKEGTVR